MSEATKAVMDVSGCTKCDSKEPGPYRISDDERLCGACLKSEHERALTIQSAYVHWLQNQIYHLEMNKPIQAVSMGTKPPEEPKCICNYDESEEMTRHAPLCPVKW